MSNNKCTVLYQDERIEVCMVASSEGFVLAVTTGEMHTRNIVTSNAMGEADVQHMSRQLRAVLGAVV